jgi:hypothetical protein
MKEETSVAWINNSVRPYESLWSIGHRFLHLNQITPKEFANEYFKDHKFRPISAIYGLSEANFNYQKFSRDLNIDKVALTKSTLNMLDNSFGNHSHEGVNNFV